MPQTVLVTGASGGLGAAVAEAFGREGAEVVLTARDNDALEAVAERVDQAGGTPVVAPADVREEDAVFEVFADAAGGAVDTIVACAGTIDGPPGEMPLTETEYETYDSVMGTNARGVFATLREGVPFLAPEGRALVPSGSVAQEAKAGMGAYAVSKAAAEALARGFAVDAPQTVGVVDPGLVATDLTGGQGRDPADVAEMFVWAATECASEDLDGERVGLKEWKRATR